MEKINNILEKYSPAIASTISLIIYLITMAPSVVQIDSGELATVQALGGVAHPTGYPLFTIVGYLFLLLPLPLSKIFMSNLLSVVFCTATVYIFTKTLRLILTNLYSEKNIFPINISAIAGSLFFAFSRTFWFQSTSVEVYSLHMLLLTIILYFLVKIFFADKSDCNNKLWLYVSFFLALSFANHLTTILILPAISFVFFRDNGFKEKAILMLGKMFSIFIPALVLLYSYLPIRAFQNPVLNWGNPINWENFFRHFSGAQYQTWIFSSFDSAKKQFVHFVTGLPGEFAIVGLLLIAGGLILVLKKDKLFSTLLVILAVTTIAYSINYDIVDIDSYFLLAYLAFSIFAAIALFNLSKLLSEKFNFTTSTLIVSLIIMFMGFSNFSEVSQHDNYIFEDYTKAILSGTEENSVVFSYQWDYFLASSYYFQYVENFRKDVAVIDKELLRRSWYYNQMNTNFPDVINEQRNNIEHFLKALKPFERGGKFDPQTLEKYYQAIMTGLAADNAVRRPYYIGIELLQNEMRNGSFKLPEGYSIVPYNLLFKVVKGNEYVEVSNPDFVLRVGNIDNKYTAFIKTTVYNMLTYRGLYELSFNKYERAKVYVDKILQLFPEFKIHEKLQSLLK